jgi:hypothetical protein
MHDIDKIYLIKGFLTDHNAPRGRRAGSQVHCVQQEQTQATTSKLALHSEQASAD